MGRLRADENERAVILAMRASREYAELRNDQRHETHPVEVYVWLELFNDYSGNLRADRMTSGTGQESVASWSDIADAEREIRRAIDTLAYARRELALPRPIKIRGGVPRRSVR